IDLLIVATVTPDMAFPSTAALLADQLEMPDAAAYDLSAGCTGFMYAIAQAYGMIAGGLVGRALGVGGEPLSKLLDREDRSPLVDECGKTVEDVDVYVPHQANIRIIDHAAKKLGFPQEKVVVNVEKYGNTSSGSIPLALADAADDGRLQPGKLVLMTGMGAGL